jgi:archaetidylinositol phosphate synthase
MPTVAPSDPPTAAPRELRFLLAGPERRVLRWIAARLPAAVTPDHLTALGIVAAVAIAVAYALSATTPAWLWAAAALLVVHWLADSLDGTLARVRRIERPTYGYYLDHLADALATACIGFGLGLSADMLLVTGAVVACAYLVLSINTYLETQALGTFALGYGRVGPTEVRLLLLALTVALALGVTPHVAVAGTVIGLLDLAGIAVVAGMAVALAVRAARNLRGLALREPAPRPSR